MKRFVALLFTLLVSSASAQMAEDFEDDELGTTDPTNNDYTYTESLGNGFSTSIVTPGLDDTTQAFQVSQSTGNGGGNFVRFTLSNPSQIQTVSLYMKCSGGNSVQGSAKTTTFALADSSGNAFGIRVSTFGATDHGNVCFLQQVSASPLNCGSSLSFVPDDTAFAGELFITITLDWAAKEKHVRIINAGGGEVYDDTTPFCNIAATQVSRIDMFGSGIGSPTGLYWYDQILIDGGPVAIEGPLAPSEFDTGLANLLISLGIVTPESQMFFVIGLVGVVLVGMAAALRWTAPGRLKNIILAGAATLVVLFMAFFEYIEEWMIIVTIVIGAFAAFGGAKVLQNTYYQVRDALGAITGTRSTSIGDGTPAMVDAPMEPPPASAGEDA